MTVLMNESYRCDLFVAERKGRKSVSLRRRIGSVSVEAGWQAVGEGAIVLWVHAERDWYTLGFTEEDPGGQLASPVTLGKAETRHLSTEMAGGFTGVYIGLYATSNRQASQAFAWFDWFEYRPSQLTGDEPIVLQPVTAKPRNEVAQIVE
jgi:xylan 1,4-beta-xylosidase